MEETKDVSKVGDEETVMGKIQEGDISDPSEEHEYMFIEKEETEYDETEDMESLVNEVLLQSAALIEGASHISDEQEILEKRPLLNQEKNIFPTPMEENSLSLPPKGTTTSTSDTVSTSVTSIVTSEVAKTQVNTSSVQTQPRVSQTTTTVYQTNNVRNGQISFHDFIQNDINMQSMQASMLQSLGLSLIEASAGDFLKTVSHSLNNTKNINFLSMGVRPGTNMRPLQAMPRTVPMAQIRAQMTRFGIPQHNLPMQCPNARNVPPIASFPPSTNVPSMAGVPPEMSGPRVPHIPHPRNVQQAKMQTAQFNLMKNLGIPLQRPGFLTPIRNVSQLNDFLNASDLVRFQMQNKNVSQVGMQCFGPISSASQSVNQATSVGNVQTQVQSCGVSRSLGSSNISPSVRNGSPFSVPRFCASQLVANALLSRIPLRPDIFLGPQMSSQQMITPQPRIPQMNIGLQRNDAPNVERLSVPNVNNGPRVGITPLSNVQRLNIPQVAACVPRINATQISGTRGMLPANTSLVSRSMNQILMTRNMARMARLKGMTQPSPSTKIPRIRVPKIPDIVPLVSLETFAKRSLYYFELMKQRSQSIFVPGTPSTSATTPVTHPTTSQTSSETRAEKLTHYTRQLIKQFTQSTHVPGTPSTSVTTPVTHPATSQTSSAAMTKTPMRHWEPASRNLDKYLLRGELPKDALKVSEQVATNTPLEVSGVQPHHQTARTSSREPSSEPHCAKNSTLEECSTKDVLKVSEQVTTSTLLEVTGVQQHQTAGTSSQQSTDELHHAKTSKLEASCAIIHQKPKPKVMSARMKRHSRNQIVFLKLWKKFEKYNYRYLKRTYKKKVEARKQRQLFLKKEKNKLGKYVLKW